VTNLVLQGSKFGRTQLHAVIHWQNHSRAGNHNSDIFHLCQFHKYPEIHSNWRSIPAKFSIQLSKPLGISLAAVS